MEPTFPRLCDKPSPYSHLIGKTSYLLEDSLGRQELKAHTAILKQELQNSRDRVTSIRAQLESAEADAASILAAVNDHTSICPPVHDMPPEILTRIFSFTIGKRFSIYKAEEGPWLFGKVCSRWRAISRSSPYLWSSFSLYIQQDLVIKDSTRIVRRLEAVLEHSKPASLYIWMNTFCPTKLIRALEPHASRLFSLQLGGGIRHLEHCLTMVDFPNLKHLTLDLGELPKTGGSRTYMDLSKCAPKLTDLKLWLTRDPDAVLPAKALILPYNQITHLDIHQLSNVVRILDILPLCTQLLWYQDTTPYSFNEQSAQPITLPYLRKLVCRGLFLIPILLCPSLNSLDFCGVFAFTEASCATIKEFFRRSRCKVYTLALGFGLEGRSFVPDFLLIFSRIQILFLEFKDQYDAGDIMSLLTYNASEPPLLPHLKTLDVTINGWCSSRPDREQSVECSGTEPERVVVDVIQSRRVVVDEMRTLRSVKIKFGHKVDLEQEGVKSLLAIPRHWP